MEAPEGMLERECVRGLSFNPRSVMLGRNKLVFNTLGEEKDALSLNVSARKKYSFLFKIELGFLRTLCMV